MKFSILALLVLPFSGFGQQNGYTINGHLKGIHDGAKVYLQERSYDKEMPKDSAVVQEGRFTFKGSVDVPHYYYLFIDNTPKGQPSSIRNWLRTGLYVENSQIDYSGNVDSLPTYFYKKGAVTAGPYISGSKAQDEYDRYRESVAPISKELTNVSTKYIQEYHIPALEGVFHTEKGIELANRENVLREKMDSAKWAFIKKNPKSSVAYDLAYEIIGGMFVTNTVDEIDDLVSYVRKGWAGTPMMTAFEERAEAAKKTAIGTKYKDFEMQTADGKKVKLSDYVPEGKVVMLEFWASWCGPCRGEIPHLKHLNKEKKDVFGIVSISLDEQEEQFKKALKEENMDWPQLVDYKGFEGEIARYYNILGIPHSIILDEQGRVAKVGLRGAYLDAYIEKMAVGN